jgi:non-specific serine/threonine protein kinase
MSVGDPEVRIRSRRRPLGTLEHFWNIPEVELVGDPGGGGAYRFGPFQLDVRERRLSRGSEVIPLRLKVFDTLCALVENAGRLLTKQELLDTVWPDTAVEENNLNHNVSALRKALGEKATGQQYIETVPRVGYRFVAAVEVGEPRFETISDGGRLAQARIDRGPPPVKAPNWLTHTSFVGRERELEELSALVPGCRLLTITGAGGSGKTRLACEAARRVQGAFPDGARMVALASVGSPELVAQAALEAVEAHEAADRPPLEALAAALQHQRMLLVFDNCEHLIGEVAGVVGFLVERAPGLHVVATSREALGLAGERVWAAPPLSLPPARAGLSLAAAERSDAVRLFIERASARDPRFALGEANYEAVARICARLDGVPLAIELAAARIGAFAAHEMARHLDSSFALLAAGGRGLPRHQTLHAAVDWSHQLLEPGERVLFARSAGFRGGFDLEAAEGVCGAEPLAPDTVARHLARLVDKSLVESERNADDALRYRVLEPLRQYAAEKLAAAGEAEALARRHLDHYLEVAERAYADRLDRAEAWLPRLEREHDNLRIALAWADGHEPARALGLAGALGWFFHMHSHFSEGRRGLRRVLARPPERSRDAARALWGASRLAAAQGDLAEASELGQRSLTLWRELGDRREVALALEPIGFSSWLAGDDAGAHAAFREQLDIYRELADERLANRAQLNVCQVLVGEGRLEEAEPIARAGLAVATRCDEIRDIHNAYHFLADCALMRGDAARARELYAESLRAALRYGDRLEAAYEIEGLAMALAGQGYDERALRLAAAAAAELEALGSMQTMRFWEELKRRYLGAAAARLVAGAATARAAGRALGFEDAVAEALDPAL